MTFVLNATNIYADIYHGKTNNMKQRVGERDSKFENCLFISHKSLVHFVTFIRVFFYFISWSKIRWPSACTRHIHLITLWVRAKKAASASRPAAALYVVCAVWHSGPDLYGDYVMHHDSGRPFVFQTRREKILRMRFYCIVSRKKASNLLMLRRNKPLKKCAQRKWDERYFATFLLFLHFYRVVFLNWKL